MFGNAEKKVNIIFEFNNAIKQATFIYVTKSSKTVRFGTPITTLDEIILCNLYI